MELNHTDTHTYEKSAPRLYKGADIRTYEISVCGLMIFCDVIPMGKDYAICIYDSKNGHIGSAVLSIPRPSLTGSGMSSTSSVLNCTGHKDEAVAREMAEGIASSMDCKVVCICGIHMDNITPDQIQEILEACRELKKFILENMRQ